MQVARTADFVLKPAGNVSYNTNKTNYGLNEEIGLSITNNSNKSIFLEPCRYFNKFEKKELNSWREVVVDNCEDAVIANSGSFEKVSLKENQSISAVILGEGIWRGVSEIYLDCRKADAGACKSKKIVYSNEFKIEAKNTEVPGAL